MSNSNQNVQPTFNSGNAANLHVSRSFNVGDEVLYHRDSPFITAYVVEIKDNGFGLWIRFAKKVNEMFVDKFVSCYDVAKNCG